MRVHTIGFCLLLSCNSAIAEEILLQTSEMQNTIIELYTSQGCSSCPPAEELLNRYKQKTGTWRKYIPMAFHVDYWDYIGWKDRFAQAAFGKRQSQYAKLQRRRTVYTPAFYVNGKNWRPGLLGKSIPRQDKNRVGKLKVRINKSKVNAVFTPHKKINKPLHLNIALLGMGLKTSIKAGENEGRLSQHEFVVLNHQKYSGRNKRWNFTWPITGSLIAPQYAIAAWVSTTDNPTPIQATGTYLPAGYKFE